MTTLQPVAAALRIEDPIKPAVPPPVPQSPLIFIESLPAISIEDAKAEQPKKRKDAGTTQKKKKKKKKKKKEGTKSGNPWARTLRQATSKYVNQTARQCMKKEAELNNALAREFGRRDTLNDADLVRLCKYVHEKYGLDFPAPLQALLDAHAIAVAAPSIPVVFSTPTRESEDLINFEESLGLRPTIITQLATQWRSYAREDGYSFLDLCERHFNDSDAAVRAQSGAPATLYELGFTTGATVKWQRWADQEAESTLSTALFAAHCVPLTCAHPGPDEVKEVWTQHNSTTTKQPAITHTVRFRRCSFEDSRENLFLDAEPFNKADVQNARILYHATPSHNVGSILEQINLFKMRKHLDFGPQVFYLTSSYSQARDYCRLQHQRFPDPPTFAILQYSIPLTKIPKTKVYVFETANDSWQKLIRASRQYSPSFRLDGLPTYRDAIIIEGPMLSDAKAVKAPRGDLPSHGHQFGICKQTFASACTQYVTAVLYVIFPGEDKKEEEKMEVETEAENKTGHNERDRHRQQPMIAQEIPVPLSSPSSSAYCSPVTAPSSLSDDGGWLTVTSRQKKRARKESGVSA